MKKHIAAVVVALAFALPATAQATYPKPPKPPQPPVCVPTVVEKIVEKIVYVDRPVEVPGPERVVYVSVAVPGPERVVTKTVTKTKVKWRTRTVIKIRYVEVPVAPKALRGGGVAG